MLRRRSVHGGSVDPGRRVRRSDFRSAALYLTAWPQESSVGQLVVVDHQVEPDADEIASALRWSIEAGFERLRTSALFPPAAAVLSEVGFRTIDTLVLMRADLLDRPGSMALPRSGPVHRVRRLPHRLDHEAALVDQLAFGDPWGNDEAGIRSIRRATPSHRATYVTGTGVRDPVVRGPEGRPRVEGFVITGSAGFNGYLQRLAVRPDRRRLGIADALVSDAIGWLLRHQVTNVLVNTGVSNEAALALYRRHGFELLGGQLIVAELDLAVTGTDRPDHGHGHEVAGTR